MRFRRHVLVAVSGVSLLAMNAPAFSRPVSRGGDQAQQQLPAQRSARQAHAERVFAASKPVLGWPELVEEARKYLGTNRPQAIVVRHLHESRAG